jgi:hypothetical protein
MRSNCRRRAIGVISERLLACLTGKMEGPGEVVAGA